MYTRPPQWTSPMTATPTSTGGYAPAVPGASQPQVNAAPARIVPGNQTFSPQMLNPASASTPLQHPATSQPAQQVTPHRVPAPPPQQTPKAASAPPQQRSAPVQQQNNRSQGSQTPEYISQKIWKINAKNKVVDFNSKLTMAYIGDFANIHGCGGSGHAGNSTIGIVICDYTKGTGDKSTTVKYSLDVEDVGFLYEAAMSARLGMLKPDPGINIAWIDNVQRILHSLTSVPKFQDGTRPVPSQALNAMNSALNNAKAATTAQLTAPLFSYSREKNNPYAVKNGLAPCSKVSITYTPYRKDGEPSFYPWYIGIENFDAPLKTGKNGASSHNSTQASNKRSAFINLSNDDFCAAMVAIQRFVSLWEHRAIPMMNEAYRRIDAARAEKENQKQSGYVTA